MEFPVVDISQIEDPEHDLRIAKEVAFASRTFGYMMLRGHGIPMHDMDEMLEIMRIFFSLPADDKTPCERTEGLVRYVTRKHCLQETVFLSGDAGELYKEADALPLYIRTKLEQVERFKARCQQIVVLLARCFAVAMHMQDKEAFARAHSLPASPIHQFRMACYPSDVPDGSQAIWQTPSSEYGSLVLVFQRRQRLEVEFARDQWASVPTEDDYAILVDAGDMVPAWSKRQSNAYKCRYTMDHNASEDARYGMIYRSIAGPHTPTSLKVFAMLGPYWIMPETD
ncbi:hypothetical protein LTR27_011926 [Elasticomyces elasticus]|nr:hypothetical protein LTR27_011926 [Elasticomyces elasticus]